jgi:sugar phosphate isomerase/epimerase
MKIGITLWNLQSVNLADKIQQVVNLGFNSISFLGSSFENEEKIIKIIKDNNLTVTFHLSFFGIDKNKIIKNLNLRLNKISQFIEKGNLEKNVWCICFDPAFNGSKSKKNIQFDFDTTVEALKHTLKKIKNIHIGIENWLINSKISELNRIKKAVNDKRLGMLLDIGHLHIAFKEKLLDRENLSDYFKSIPFKIIEFHIHDNNGEDSHLPLGRGSIDILNLLNIIRKSANFYRNAVLTLEIRPNSIEEIIKSKEILIKQF